MKNMLFWGATFVIALFGVEFLCNAAHNALVLLQLAHIQTGIGWLDRYAAFETAELFVYVLIFGSVGALLARFTKSHRSVVYALTFGIAHSLLAFAWEPTMPFVRYSHAPSWLWVLSWSQFYMPAIAGAVAAAIAYAFHKSTSGRVNAA